MLWLFGGGAPRVGGSFLFRLVSDALDVGGTGAGDCKLSEDLSETSFSLRSASVVTVSLANTARAVVGILWREIETGYVTTWGMYESERQMERDRENSHRRQSTAEN